MILFIDNYDSFSYMLVDYCKQLALDPVVVRNDTWSMEAIIAAQPTAIIISPGPGVPATSGQVMAVIDHFYQQVPILGICLGHQAIGTYFGAQLLRSETPVHGITAQVTHYNDPVFKHIPNPFTVMRYHSLELHNLPEDVTPTCHTNDGIIMGLQHKAFPLTGLQFHPESILTPDGFQLMKNWVTLNIRTAF